MGSKDPVFAFKRHFNKSDADTIFSSLVHHKVIWNALGDEAFLESLVSSLPLDAGFWNAPFICMRAAGLEPNPGKTPHDYYEQISDVSDLPNKSAVDLFKQDIPLDQIAGIAAHLIHIKDPSQKWNDFLISNQFTKAIHKSSLNLWGSVFSLIYFLQDEKQSFVADLANAEKEELAELLAFILAANPSIIESDLQSLEKCMNAIPIENFNRLLEKMGAYETDDIIRRLSDSYLYENPIEKHFHLQTKDNFSDSLIRDIGLYKNYTILSRSSSSKQLADEYSNKAFELSEQLSQGLGILKRNLEIRSQNSRVSLEDMANSISISSPAEKKLMANGTISKVLQAVEIKNADPETARNLGERIYLDVCSSTSLQQIIPPNALGLSVQPSEIVTLLEELGLLTKAAQVSRKLLEYLPANTDLLRKSAGLCNKYGDHQKAIECFLKLEIIDELTREEQIQLADGLEKIREWPDALAVWKNIYPVSLDDYQKKAICAYYADDLSGFEEIVNAARGFYQTDGLFQVIQALFDMKRGSRDMANEAIQAVIDSRKRDQRVISIILEYFLETSQNQKAIEFINTLSSLEQDLPEVCIKRCQVFEKAAENEICCSILENISRNKSITELGSIVKLIELSFSRNKVEYARELIESYAERWPLSPEMIDYQARIYIHDGNFIAAKELLGEIISRENASETWLVDYGLALTGCRQDSFPLRSSIATIDKEKKIPSNLQKLFDDSHDNLLLKIIKAELFENEKLEQYKALLADKGTQHNPDIWRVHAGMGKYYYQHGSYDLAVVSFREARKAQPRNKTIDLYLINALAKMRLYEDAINIFTSHKVEEALDLNEFLEINSSLKNSDQWLKTLQELDEKLPDNRSTKILLAQNFLEKGKRDKVLETVQRIDFTSIQDPEEHLVCSQILIKAGLVDEAKHILEYLLAAKNDLSGGDLLSGAFLFYQMDEVHKTANLLNLINKPGYAILAFKSDLYLKLDLLQEAQSAIKSAIEAYENNAQFPVPAPNRWIEQQEFWKTVIDDPKGIYLKTIEIKALSRDMNAALADAQQSIQRFPDSILMQTMAANLANLLADDQTIDELLENLPDDLPVQQICEDMCVWGEIALRKGQEILAANLTSQLLEVIPESNRVKALQARLLKRNGNTQDAQQLMDDILEDHEKSENGFSSGFIIEFQPWLAEAAQDFGRFSDAMKICEKLFEKSCITAQSARVFLSSLLQLSYANWIDQKLLVVNHSIPLDESDHKYFEDICLMAEESLKDDRQIFSTINSIKIWLGTLNGESNQISNLRTDEMNDQASIVSHYYREGGNRADILTEQSDQDVKAKFIMALLEMESNPEKAAKNLTEFIRQCGKHPRHYAALAIIKKNQGQIDDAYAAINLALAEWPDEYKWQLLAGELSKQLGDLHSAMKHFRNASEMHQDERTQEYLGELNLQAKNRFGIPYLEEKLAGNSQDFDTLIKLGELGIKNSKYQKAAKYLETARHYKPLDPQPYILMSQVALKVGNQFKAEEIIDQALQVKSNDTAVILQKAAVIQNGQGTSSALEFVEKYANSLLSLDPAMVIRKAAYLSELESNEQALAFLLSQSKNMKHGELAAETAGYLLKTGQLVKAEELAEQALQADPDNPAHLELLARISTENGDLDKALDFLVKAIQIDPFMPELYIAMAKIYQSRRDLKQAEVVLQSGLRSNPMNFDLLSSLGLLYYQQGVYKKSEEVLKQASTIDPYNQNIKRILSTLMNANIIQAGTTDGSIIQEV